MLTDLKIGIIGGSGMEDPGFISDSNSKDVSTPYGDPSSQLILGSIADVPVVILSRHGPGHSINPTNVNYRANISALKEEGCTHILAATACGSLRARIAPGHFVFPDQFIDRTTKRITTFFDGSDVRHVSMGEPFSAGMRNCLVEACKRLGFEHHNGGTVVTIEGPRFSTKAESIMFRSWGCDIINMSTVPEIILARELDLHYQSMAMCTDYDCWHESEEEVTMEMIYAVMEKNVNNVKKLIEQVIPLISKQYKKEN
jgi:5'-methylthioadenosine phosphorylase